MTTALTRGAAWFSPSRSTVRSGASLAIAVSACLVVTVASPQAAVAVPGSERIESAPTPAAQAIRGGSIGAGQLSSVDRNDFAVTLPARTRPAVRPVDGSIPDQGNFGGRSVRGCSACSTSHQGTDFAAPTGTAIVSVLDGVVVTAGPSGGYGNMVLVRHANGLQTRYGHMSAIDVRTGQQVQAGTRLGAVGSTGVSTGSHLHFEVIIDGRAIDPVPWLRVRGIA
ncbi:M23 family metallopeptidase [Curtobacterium sp. Leaf261]|uniref:M23 family metallopeptidase n=1 Tax=Curtobacterium sp. Leaf261 TaxID=1736311 RepID=UPI0006FB20ED|nr:M23 family metallopeptidase [Curtobacterium sp. Leaf261]KQO60296.1 hypothetical protein ASF23_13775 [Curtobacterium sp. Leaf261]